MHEMPSNNSMATTGKEEPSKFVKTDTPTVEEGSKVVKVDSEADSEQEADMVVATEAEVEDSVVEVASAAEEVTEEDLAVEVDSRAVEISVLIKEEEDMAALRKRLLLRIHSPTLPPAVVNVGR